MIRRTWLLALWLVACKGTDLDKYRDGDREAALRETLDLNLQKTRAFFLQSAEPATGETGTDCQQTACPQQAALQKLIAVQDDGSRVEVNVTDDDLDDSGAQPEGFVDTPAYLFFFYRGVMYNGKECGTIPVRKSDGALFCVPCKNPPCARGDIVSNSDGTSIYRLENYVLRRLQLDGRDNSQEVEISSPQAGGGVSSIVINEPGDLLTTIDGKDVRLYREGGGFVNLARGLQSPVVFAGPGKAGTLYWVRQDFDSLGMGEPATLNRVFTSAEPVTGAAVFSDANGLLGIAFGKAATATATYAVGWTPGYGTSVANRIVEVLNASEKPRIIPSRAFAEIKTLLGCADHLIVGGIDANGNEVVARNFPGVPTEQTLAATKDYVISKLVVDSACRITFSGRRSSDNARLVGQIEPGSDTVKVIAEDLSADVTQILAIH